MAKIRIKWKDDERTCSACEVAQRGMFSVAIGPVTFSVCRACMHIWRMSLRRAERDRSEELYVQGIASNTRGRDA